MQETEQLDILVIYDASIALSPTVPDSTSLTPFLMDSSRANYNISYAYFLDYCHELALKAGFAASSDIIGPGSCSSYWTHDSSGWSKVMRPAHAHQIFDKLSPSDPERTSERNLLLSDPSIIPYHDPALFLLFLDKLHTFQEFPEHSVPTASIYSSRPRDIKISLDRLSRLINNHQFPADFGTSLVLKDRFGAGGEHVYKIKPGDVNAINVIMRDNPTIRFIIQPFLLFDKGFTYRGKKASTDIRLIIESNQLFHKYIRIAKGDEFRCNTHQGGQIIYLEEDEIPRDVISISKVLIKKINKPHSLYALDFIISNQGHPYFIEGNSKPGLDWNPNSKVRTANGHRLIRQIIKELARRLNS